MNNEPQITQFGLLGCQACVPTAWTDEQVIAFAEEKFPCGTSAGWVIRKEGSELLKGSHERVECDGRKGFIHIMLDA